MKPGDKIICIKKYYNLIKNNHYILGACADNFTTLGYRYFIGDDKNYYYFNNDEQLKNYFISLQELRKQKLKNLHQTR